MTSKQQRFFFLIIIGGSLAFRLFLAVTAKNPTIEDSRLYFWAARIYEDIGLLKDHPTFYPNVRVRTPLYPYVILAVEQIKPLFSLSTENLLCVINVLFFCLFLATLFHIVQAIASAELARFAVVIAAIEPSAIPYSVAAMPESISLTLFTMGWYFIVRRVKGSNAFGLLASGVSVALASLAKPVFFYSEAIFFLALILSTRRRFPISFANATLHLFAFVVVVSPWFYRNWKVWNVITFSPQNKILLYDFVRTDVQNNFEESFFVNGSVPLDRDPKTHRKFTYEEMLEKFDLQNETLAKQFQFFTKLAVDDFLANPLPLLKLWLVRYPQFYVGSGVGALAAMLGEAIPPESHSWNGIWKTRWGLWTLILMMVQTIVYCLAFAGLYAAWKQLDRAWFVGIGLSAFYFSLSILTLVHTRYRFPMLLAFSLLGGFGYHELSKKMPVFLKKFFRALPQFSGVRLI